jgi:hypothetical protein
MANYLVLRKLNLSRQLPTPASQFENVNDKRKAIRKIAKADYSGCFLLRLSATQNTLLIFGFENKFGCRLDSNLQRNGTNCLDMTTYCSTR